MTSTSDEPQLLKTDRRGRVRVPKERRDALLAEFARSGVSAAEFARLAGVKYATFMCWVAKERRRGAAAVEATSSPVAFPVPGEGRAPRAAVRLFEALVESPAPGLASRPLCVELPGGARLHLSDLAQVAGVAQLLLALAQRGGRSC